MREHTGSALGIAIVATLGFTVWASFLAIVLWLSLTIYAIVKWIGAPADHASPLTVLLLLVGNVTVFLLLMTAAMYAVGKPMRHKKRADRIADEMALAAADQD